jgi:hypothetical protein
MSKFRLLRARGFQLSSTGAPDEHEGFAPITMWNSRMTIISSHETDLEEEARLGANGSIGRLAEYTFALTLCDDGVFWTPLRDGVFVGLLSREKSVGPTELLRWTNMVVDLSIFFGIKQNTKGVCFSCGCYGIMWTPTSCEKCEALAPVPKEDYLLGVLAILIMQHVH